MICSHSPDVSAGSEFDAVMHLQAALKFPHIKQKDPFCRAPSFMLDRMQDPDNFEDFRHATTATEWSKTVEKPLGTARVCDTGKLADPVFDHFLNRHGSWRVAMRPMHLLLVLCFPRVATARCRSLASLRTKDEVATLALAASATYTSAVAKSHCPWTITDAFPHIWLSDQANEALLIHGHRCSIRASRGMSITNCTRRLSDLNSQIEAFLVFAVSTPSLRRIIF